jgi:quercetin dioxygenase-like cupin family protein
MRALWDAALDEARKAHTGALAAFCPFPDDLAPTEVQPFRLYAGDLFATERAAAQHPLAQAFQACAQIATWRETYKGTDIFPDFLRRFGCFCLIGQGGAFSSAQMSAYLVYMPPRLNYPFHHHPAEELYYVLAGAPTFQRQGAEDELLTQGMWCQHAGNQPHATQTHADPLIAYVVWRNNLGIKPVWTEEALG